MKKIFVFGFKPYGKRGENITEKIIKDIKEVRFVFSVVMDGRVFIKKIKKINPDIILGLGQCSRGNFLRIERKATNCIKKGLKIFKISRRGPQMYFANLKIRPTREIRYSYNSGKYVCNFAYV
jgi:pyrrolidone-carboxylate peptidase